MEPENSRWISLQIAGGDDYGSRIAASHFQREAGPREGGHAGRELLTDDFGNDFAHARERIMLQTLGCADEYGMCCPPRIEMGQHGRIDSSGVRRRNHAEHDFRACQRLAKIAGNFSFIRNADGGQID